jgi:hypothetical protein
MRGYRLRCSASPAMLVLAYILICSNRVSKPQRERVSVVHDRESSTCEGVAFLPLDGLSTRKGMRRENLAGACVNPRSTRPPPIPVKALACDLQKSKQRTGVSNLPHAAVDTVGRSISRGVQPGGVC